MNGIVIFPVTFSRTIRRVEVVLSLFVLGTVVTFAVFDGVPGVIPENDMVRGVLFVAVFLAAPPVLGLVVLLASVTDEIGIGSVAAGMLALVPLLIVVAMVYALVTSAGDGGVFFGHLFAYAAALILSVAALLRPALDRLFTGVWRRPGLIPADEN